MDERVPSAPKADGAVGNSDVDLADRTGWNPVLHRDDVRPQDLRGNPDLDRLEP